MNRHVRYDYQVGTETFYNVFYLISGLHCEKFVSHRVIDIGVAIDMDSKCIGYYLNLYSSRCFFLYYNRRSIKIVKHKKVHEFRII